MNVKTLSIVTGLIAAFGSSAALAVDEYALNQNYPTPITSSTPRVVAKVVVVDEYQMNQNPVVAASGLQRAQVVAEAIEARKLGLISHGELSAPTPTSAHLAEIRLAGLRAVSTQFAGK